MSSAPQVIAWFSLFGASIGFLHCAVNLRLLRRPPKSPPLAIERVYVLIPARNEASRIATLLDSLSQQQALASWQLIVADDGSTDHTAQVVSDCLATIPHGRLLRLPDTDPPAGWLGKAWACHQLSEQAADASVLVFIDADVTLAPTAIASAVATLRTVGLSVVCPYPRQTATTLLQRLVQPLLQWSWATTLPLRIAERSKRASLTAGNGQFLVVDRRAYDAAGGHAAVRAEVLEDIALVRRIKNTGGTGGLIDGTALAECRMYDQDRELIDGYTKSLWSAFGTPAGALLVCAVLAAVYLSPVVLVVLAAMGAVGSTPTLLITAGAAYMCGVLNRILVDHRVRARAGDALLHPLSIACFCWLVALSLIRRQRADLQWKGRVLR